MDFNQEVLSVLAEVCQDDIVKENPDIDIFEEGILDSFGTVELPPHSKAILTSQCRLQSLTGMHGTRQIKS